MEVGADRVGENVPEVEGDDVGGHEIALVLREDSDWGCDTLGLNTLG